MANSIDVIQSVDKEVQHCLALLPGKRYHVFLSYRDVEGDRQWVQDLIEKLETTYKLKCCNHINDFRPGRKIVDNIKDAIISSVKTLIILSKDYHESFWCTYEAEYTHQLSMELRERIIIPVLKEDCDIPDHMKPFTYIDARGPISQWLPILVSTIEEPVSGIVDSKYSQLDFNSRLRNFDIVHEEKTVFRCCGCRSSLPFKPRRYLPDSLSSKLFNLTYSEYQGILSIISSTFLIKHRHTGQPWIPTILCCVLPILTILCMMISHSLVTVLKLYGNLKEFALEIIQQKIYYSLDKPLTQNTTVDEVLDYLTARRGGALGVLIIFTVLIMGVICIFIICAANGTCMKKRCIEKEVKKTNELLIRHNLLAGMTSNCLTGTAKIIFIYFDHLPCLKSLSEYLKNNKHITKHSYGKNEESRTGNFTNRNDADVPLLNIEMDINNDPNSLRDENMLFGDRESTINQQGEISMSNTKNDEDLKIEAMKKLYEVAPDYVWDFVNNKIEHTASGIHSTRVTCLCEYIMKREKSKRSDVVIQVEGSSRNDDDIITV